MRKPTTMLFVENIKEAIKAIKDNLLRSVLTATIVAIGLTALVGIFTAIDAIQNSISSELSDLGANSFDIQDIQRRRRRRGRQQRIVNPISFDEAMAFGNRFSLAKRISINTSVTQSAEIKHLSKKTNPNTSVVGIDKYYLKNQGLKLAKGRKFSNKELSSGANVAILGEGIISTLFKKNIALGKTISMRGRKYTIVGIIKKSGGLHGGAADRTMLIPILHANKMVGEQRLRYKIVATVSNPSQIQYAIGEATGLMRLIRKDPLNKPESFEITRSDSMIASMQKTASTLQLGSLVIGLITLAGAAIGLMNIMLVSVTERTREIGVRKALGATTKRIKEQFLIESVVICLIGGSCGIVVGLIAGNLVARLAGDITFIIPWLWIIVGIIVCIIVGVSSGFFPAKKAAKLNPIESLRYE